TFSLRPTAMMSSSKVSRSPSETTWTLPHPARARDQRRPSDPRSATTERPRATGRFVGETFASPPAPLRRHGIQIEYVDRTTDDVHRLLLPQPAVTIAGTIVGKIEADEIGRADEQQPVLGPGDRQGAPRRVLVPGERHAEQRRGGRAVIAQRDRAEATLRDVV